MEKFQTKVNVAHAVGALDGKHITMKKPKRSGSEYCELQGHLFTGAASPGRCRLQIPLGRYPVNITNVYKLVLLALVDADYRFLWVDIASSLPIQDLHQMQK